MYDADLKGYFDTIPHEQLLKAVQMRVADRQVLRLIRALAGSVIEETDERGRRPCIVQAGHAARRGDFALVGEHLPALVRGAVPAAGRTGQLGQRENCPLRGRLRDSGPLLGPRIVSWIEETLEGRFRLTINREKTRVVRMHQPGASLNFLGFTFRYEQDLFGRNHRYLRVEPSRKAEDRLREKVRELTGPQWGWMPLPILIGRLNRTLRGWCAYFRHGHPHRVFHRLDGYLLDRLRQHLRRRSQRRYRTSGRTTLWTPICSATACNSSQISNILCMPHGEKFSGKPDAGNLPVRFDEGRGGSFAAPLLLDCRLVFF